MDESNIVKFGLYLKDLRERKGLTLIELAEKIGYSDAYISQVEKGRRKNPPTLELLKKLSEGLNVPYSELLKEAGYEDIAEGQRYKEIMDEIRDLESFGYSDVDFINLGEYVKGMREHLGYSIEKVAEMTGLEIPLINKIENENIDVEVDTLASLSRAFTIQYPLVLIDLLRYAGYIGYVDAVHQRVSLTYPRLAKSGYIEQVPIAGKKVNVTVKEDNIYDLDRVLRQLNHPVLFVEKELYMKEKDLLRDFIELLLKHR